jgi:hypothetical protein
MRIFGRAAAVLALAALLLLCLFSGLVFGQAVEGMLLGTVKDSSGGVIPNAKVVITEVNTGVSRTTQTNASGNYVFPSLDPGLYQVAVESAGFSKAIKDRVQVLVNTSVRADVELKPGEITDIVTVTASTAMLQTDRADTGRKIEEVQLEAMPLAYGRNFQSLLNLVPGTTRAFAPHSEFFNSQNSLTTQVNGVAREGNNVQFEGVDNNHRTGLLTVMIPPIEAIETVDVSTSNYEAELGRAGGAVTNISLRSGTNQLHGAVYEFNKTSALCARETFSPTKPVTTYNYYGFNIGGPIRKNKTFIFGDYLGVKDRRGDSYVLTVPTPAYASGDFSSLLVNNDPNNANSIVIYDPATGDPKTGLGRQPFPGNKIPDARISPIAKKILAMVKPPNNGTQLTNNYATSTVRSKDTESFDIKLDHNQTEKDRFSARYSFQRPVVTDPGIFGIYGGGGKGFAATGINRTQSAAVNYTRLFSTTLIMEALVGLSRYANKAQNLDYGTKAADQLGIKGINLDDWTSGLPQITIAGYANPLVGYTASLPWNRAETNIDFINNWTKVLHNHTIKFGADIRRLRDELLQTQDAGGPRGQISFGSNQTSITGKKVQDQANALASMLVDAPYQLQRDLAIVFPAYRATMLFAYVQDKWTVTPKLTLDIGLRWEFYPPATPRLKGGFSNYDPSTNSWNVAGYGSIPMNLGRKTYYKDFAPRLGMAYRLNEKTVFRLGSGISWIPFPDNKCAWDNYPVKQNAVYNNLGTYGQSVGPDGSILTMASGFPAPTAAVIPSSGIIPTALTSNVNSFLTSDYHEGYIESWNIAVQRQLPKNFTLETSYVGNHTVRAPVGYNINAGFIFGAGSIGKPLYAKFGRNVDTTQRYAGYSNNYNSLQVKFDRRFSGGFLLVTGYTWSKAMGYSSEDGGLWNYIDPRRSYSRLDFDRTQTFTQSYAYELPFGPNKPFAKNGVGRWLLGDWQINGVLTLMTGLPFTVTTTTPAGQNGTPGSTQTADMTGSFNVLHGVAGNAGTNLWFDTSIFSAPSVKNSDGTTTYHWGNTGHNAFSGPGLANLDLSIFRKFAISERVKGEFRCETFNFTNTPAFANPNSQQGSTTFGRVTGTLTGLINNVSYGGTGARQVQFALKLSF